MSAISSSKARRGAALLLESILGIGLFSIAFLVVLGLFASIAHTNSQSRQYALAHQLARTVLEREIHKAYASVLDVSPQLVPLPFENNGNLGTVDFNAEFRVFTAPAPGAFVAVTGPLAKTVARDLSLFQVTPDASIQTLSITITARKAVNSTRRTELSLTAQVRIRH